MGTRGRNSATKDGGDDLFGLLKRLQNLMHICDVFKPKQCEIFLSLMETLNLKVIVSRKSVCVCVICAYLRSVIIAVPKLTKRRHRVTQVYIETL